LRRFVGRQGLVSVATIRVVPIAPFTAVNLVAGALKVRLVDYVLGTLLGLTPGLILLSFAGDRASAFLANPSWREAAVVLVVLLAWIGVSVTLQIALRRRGRA